MANFLSNLWAKTRDFREKAWVATSKFIKAPLVAVASTVGLGGATAAALAKIDENTQASIVRAVQRDGVIKNDKLEETLAKNGVKPTTENVNGVAKVVNLAVEQETGTKVPVDKSSSEVDKPKNVIIDYLRRFWAYLVGGAILIYMLFFMKKNKY